MKPTKLALCLLLTAALALVSGCSLISGGEQKAEDKGRQGAVGRYYDFDDIQVPVQLKLNKEASILFKVGAFKAGVLVFEDNLELESLINFFVDSMAKDNWTLKSSFKYPKSALFFAKPGKTCVIQITESTFKTTVEIWVAPAS
ncbi:MAG: hypothetical protein ACOZHQ_10090 [Thermodesulfobacteriota bacterium]